MKSFTKLFAAAAVTAAAVASPAMAGPYVNVGIGTGFGADIDGDINGIDFEADARTTVGGGIGLGYDFGGSALNLTFSNLVFERSEPMYQTGLNNPIQLRKNQFQFLVSLSLKL